MKQLQLQTFFSLLNVHVDVVISCFHSFHVVSGPGKTEIFHFLLLLCTIATTLLCFHPLPSHACSVNGLIKIHHHLKLDSIIIHQSAFSSSHLVSAGSGKNWKNERQLGFNNRFHTKLFMRHWNLTGNSKPQPQLKILDGLLTLKPAKLRLNCFKSCCVKLLTVNRFEVYCFFQRFPMNFVDFQGVERLV